MIEQIIHTIQHHALFKGAIAFVIGVLSYFFDLSIYSALVALFVLAIMDLLTAFLARGENPIEPFSRPIRKTAHKIAGYFVSISSVYILSNALQEDMQIDITILDNTLVWFFIVHEVVSIIENLNKSGIPIPLPFLDKLKKVKEIIAEK